MARGRHKPLKLPLGRKRRRRGRQRREKSEGEKTKGMRIGENPETRNQKEGTTTSTFKDRNQLVLWCLVPFSIS